MSPYRLVVVGDRRTAAAAVVAAAAVAALLPAGAADARPGAPGASDFTFTGTAARGAIAVDALLAHPPATWRQLVADALPGTAVTHVPNGEVRAVLATGDQRTMRALLGRTAPVPAPARVVPFAGAYALVRTERIEAYVESVVGAVPAGASADVADVIAVATRSRAAAQAAHGYVVPCAAAQCVRVGLTDTTSAMGRAARATRGLVISSHGAVVPATLPPSRGWKRVLSASEIAAKLGYAGRLDTVAISRVDAHGVPDRLTLSGSAGDRITDARTLARALGLPAAPDRITAPLTRAGSELSGLADVGDAGLAAAAIDATPIQPAELPALEPAPLTDAAVPAPVVAPALPAALPAAALPGASSGTLALVLPPSVLSDLLGGLLTTDAPTPATDGLDLLGALAESSLDPVADPAAALDLLVPTELEPSTITAA